jgi:hypothetical protein
MDKQLKHNRLLLLVLLNTIIAFLVDLYAGYPEYWLQIVVVEVPIIAVIFLALRGHNWAYIATVIYYLIRSFNLYFEDLYLVTKNGLNFELSINSIGVNVVSLILFIMLFYDTRKRFDTKITRFIRTSTAVILGLIVTTGLLSPKPAKYKSKKYETPMLIELDTVSSFPNDFSMEIPADWKIRTNQDGVNLFAISPVRDSLDRFKENLNVQVFNVNLKIFGAETIGNRLYENGTKDLPYNVRLISKEFSREFPDYYTIDYVLSDSAISVRSKMYCLVAGRKAFSIVFSDTESSFEENLSDVFLPIFRTLERKK